MSNERDDGIAHDEDAVSDMDDGEVESVLDMVVEHEFKRRRQRGYEETWRLKKKVRLHARHMTSMRSVPLSCSDHVLLDYPRPKKRASMRRAFKA